MNFKTTLILLALVVVGIGLWLYTGQSPPPAEQKAEETPAAPAEHFVLDPRPERNDVVRVELARADQPTLVFQRTAKEGEPDKMDLWRMTEPLQSATESYLVDGLASMLTGLQYTRSFKPGAEGGASLAEAGLEPPTATLTIQDKQGKTYALQIGKKVALSNDTYVRVVGSDEIKVIGRDVQRDMERKVNDYRAKRLTVFSPPDAHQVLINYEGKAYDFTRGAGDEWVINSPVKAYAQADKVKALINGLSGVRAKEFVDDAPKSLSAYGLEPPMLTFNLITEKKEKVPEEPASQPAEAEANAESEQTAENEDVNEPTTQPAKKPRFKTVTETYGLEVGGFADLENQTRYIKLADQPWVASATTQQLDRLIPKLAELRDPHITRVKASSATRLEITSDGTASVLEKRGGKWQGSGDLAQLDNEAVKKVLETFEDLTAIDYIDEPKSLAEYGLDEPRAVVSVTTSGAVEPVSLHIGADTPSGRNTYVQVAGQPSVEVVSAERAKELAIRPISLRSREITALNPGEIKQVSVERDHRRYVVERTPRGENWRMLEPADAPPDPGSIRELVNDLSRLRAADVVAKDADAEYGLTEPAVTIHFVAEKPIEITGPPATPESQPTTQATQPAPSSAPATERVEHTLVVGRKDGKSYARIDDEPYIFELDETVYNVLTEELIRRGLFDIKADEVDYVKIQAPGGVVEFERIDGQWTYPPDKFLKLAQKTVGDFVKELAELRVDAYMAYRAGELAKYGLQEAPVTVTLRLKDGQTITLKVDQVRPGELPRKAAWVEKQRVFLLREAEAEKLMRGLDYYLYREPAPGDNKKKAAAEEEN